MSYPVPRFARLVAAFVGALSMLATLVAVDTVNPAGAAVAKTFYVAPIGNNSAAGTAAAPYRTIKKAVARASSGDTMVLWDGVYRESVYIYGKAIKLESAQGERAVMEGARAVGGFRSSGGDWYASGWTKEFQTNTGPMVLAGNPARRPPRPGPLERDPAAAGAVAQQGRAGSVLPRQDRGPGSIRTTPRRA